jgi:hypothetical protein
VLVRLDMRLDPDRLKATDVIREVRDIWTPYVDIDFADSGTRAVPYTTTKYGSWWSITRGP